MVTKQICGLEPEWSELPYFFSLDSRNRAAAGVQEVHTVGQ